MEKLCRRLDFLRAILQVVPFALGAHMLDNGLHKALARSFPCKQVLSATSRVPHVPILDVARAAVSESRKSSKSNKGKNGAKGGKSDQVVPDAILAVGDKSKNSQRLADSCPWTSCSTM